MKTNHQCLRTAVTGCFAALLIASAACADYTDAMKSTDGFEPAAGPVKVVAADGKVTISKTASGDAFAFYHMQPAGTWFDVTPSNDVLEIDFDAFPDSGAAQIVLCLKNANGEWKDNVVCQEHLDKPGRFTVESIKQLLAKKGFESDTAYQLCIRVVNDPQGSIVISRIHVGDKPTPAMVPGK